MALTHTREVNTGLARHADNDGGLAAVLLQAAVLWDGNRAGSFAACERAFVVDERRADGHDYIQGGDRGERYNPATAMQQQLYSTYGQVLFPPLGT